MRQEMRPTSVRGNVQKSPSSKAAALLTRGAYSQYVSTTKRRPAYAKPLQQAWNRWLVSRSFSEGWRLFSTFPRIPFSLLLGGIMFLVQSCGVVGPPLAPEDIGIEAKIRSQEKAEAHTIENSEQEIVPLDQEDVSLPPLQPLGTQ